MDISLYVSQIWRRIFSMFNLGIHKEKFPKYKYYLMELYKNLAVVFSKITPHHYPMELQVFSSTFAPFLWNIQLEKCA